MKMKKLINDMKTMFFSQKYTLRLLALMAVMMLALAAMPLRVKAQTTYIASDAGCVLGTGTSGSYEAPINLYYRSYLTQQIYTASEIGMSGTIGVISFQYNSSSSITSQEFSIYLGLVSKSTFSSTTDWVPINDMSLVWTGTITTPNTAGAWVTINLDYEFYYDNSYNLVICCYDNDASVTYPGSSSTTFRYTSTSSNYRTLYARSDSTPPTTSSAGSRTYYRPNLKLRIGSKTVTTCSGTFYDSGGSSGNYDIYEDYVWTFQPSTSGAKIQLDFTAFGTESGYDFMEIYDGTSTSANLIDQYTDTYSPGVVTATNNSGALTCYWHSDVSNVDIGFAANISCVTPKTLTFSASPSAGGTVTVTNNGSSVSSGASILPGTILDIYADDNSGYVFSNWTVSGTGASVDDPYDPYTTLTMGTANTTLTAVFSAPPSPTTMTCGQTYSGTVGNSYSYFDSYQCGWSGQGEERFYSYTPPVTGNYTFTCIDHNDADFYLLPSVNNNVSCITYCAFGDMTATLTAGTTYYLIVDNCAGSSSGYSVEVSCPKYTLTTDVSPSGAGSVSGNNGPYEQGETCQLTANPSSGYVFSHWSVSGTGAGLSSTTTNPTTFTMGSANATVTAYFTRVYTLTWSNPTGGTISVTQNGNTVSSGQSFPQNTQFTITATPSSGYAFSGWTSTGSPTIANSSSASTTLTMGTDNVVLSASFAQEIIVGDHTGTSTSSELPSQSFYNYTLSQQIYTPCEIGVTGSLSGIAFYNGGTTKTRTYDIYLVTTTKETFSSTTDWITVTASDMVFSGSVTMTAGVWTWIPFSSSFYYDGTSNLAVIMDDNTGSYSSGMACRVYDANGYQALRVRSDGTNYNPLSPSSYTGTQYTVKNQIKFSSNNAVTRTPVYVTVSANDNNYGTVTGGGCFLAGTNTSTTVTATPNSCYKFVNWTKNGSQVSTNATYTFTVTEDVDLVANFEDEWTVNPNTENVAIECVTSGTSMTFVPTTTIPVEYSFAVTSGSFSSISGTGTSSVTGDDNYSSPVNIGFPFNYWGKIYRTAVIATNGYLRLGNGSDGYTNELQSTSRYNILAAFWDDLDATSTYYTTTGTEPNRIFVMEHYGYRHGSAGQTFRFQIRLYETTNVIEFWYGNGFPDLTNSNTSASIGLNNRENDVTSFISVTPTGSGTATTSTTTANNSIGTTQCDYLTSGTIYRFTPTQITYSWSCTAGTSGTASGNTYTVSPTASTNTYRVEASYGGCTKRADVTVTVKPAAPTNLQISSITSTTATASWSANGASNWQYNYNGTWYDTSSTSVNLTGLTPGTNYTFQVKAIGGSCESSVVSTSFAALTRHTVTYNANGGSGTMTDSNSPYDYGSTVTVLANSFTRTGYVFNCWNTAADGSGTKYVAGNTFTISANTTLYAQWAPIVIANTTQWNEFCAAVNGGFTYSGLTVTLTDDISVTTTAGTSQAISFQGTFDGDCHTLTFTKTGVTTQLCAPFMWIMDATIQNLHTTGTISTSHQMAAGIVGRAFGNCFFTNCRSSMEITTSRNGDGTHGGLLAVLNDKSDSGSSRAVFTGCVFDGKLVSTYSGGTTNNGGLVGCSHYNYVDFTNCLFSPSVVTNMSGGSTCTFSRPDGTYNARYFTFNNCYYTQTLGRAQAKQAYTLDYAASPVAGGTVSHSTTGTAYCIGLTAYSPGLGYDIDNDAVDELLLGNAENASLTATANSGYTFMNWTDGSTTPTANPYTVSMGTANRSVTANFINQTASNDWTTAVDAIGDVPSGGISVSSGNVTIGNREGLAWFISMVNGLNGEDGNTFSGYNVNLTADVDMSAHTWVPIGTTEHPFSGTFNGNGHVIKGITRSTDFPHDGLFGYVSGNANIQNVVVQASLTGNSHATGAVVGTFASTGTISNVEGAGTLTGGTLTTALGGIAGNNTGGTIHSSFSVATMTGGASATQMGGLVGNNTGNLYNSYSNATYSGTSATKGGLVGSNSGTVENCYAAGIASGVSAFAGSNNGSGTIQNCYTDAVGSGYIGTNTTAPTGSGTYGAVQSSIKHLDYMYRDNLITANTNTYVGGSGVTSYVGNHIPVWNGLVSALNQWVRANPRSLTGLAPWYRPISGHINSDLPVLGFAMDNSLGTLDSDGKFLQYGSNQNGGNGLDAVLTTFNNNTASIFHYGKATGVANVPTANVKVSIAEDAVLLQGNGAGAFTATVGVTFDNSDHGQHAYDFWGNKLNYDWHLMSSPLNNPLTGATHSSYNPSGNPNSPVDITAIGGYFPNGLPMSLHDTDWKWDFYSYYEPQYHWINLKRNKKNHYHQDGGAQITYNEADQDLGDNTAHLIPGKGYMMAISQNTFMNQSGTLNHGDVPITFTNQEPDGEHYSKGWNLVGNPYQAYLDLEAMNRLPVYIYDAEQGIYVPYAKESSSNPVLPSRYIHPHQAFFMHAEPTTPATTEAFTFQQAWATTDSNAASYFRDEHLDYPLVNLFAENSIGQRDLTVVEFHRPEIGGAPKLDAMRNMPFTLAAHHNGTAYGILFSTDDMERIPVHFKTDEDDQMTLTWSIYNGEFSQLHLFDNLLGVNYDMLSHDSYTFTARASDYASRFYITYECTGVDEDDDSGGPGGGSFAYVSHGNIVVDVTTGSGTSLQLVDMLGRVLYSTVCTDGVHTISTNGLAKGVYLIRLTTNKSVRTQKLIVQ